MAAINCNTITGTQHPAPSTPPTAAKLLHTSDPTSTSLMIRKTDQWKCSLVDENPCCLCNHAHYWPWGHPLVKVWPGGGWWLGWCSSLPLSGFIASLQPGPRAALQHCSLQSAAACTVTCQHRGWWILLHFPAHYFTLFAYFPIHALIFPQQEQADWPLAGLQSCIGCASEYSQHP